MAVRFSAGLLTLGLLFAAVSTNAQDAGWDNSVSIAAGAQFDVDQPFDRATARVGFSISGVFEVGAGVDAFQTEVDGFDGVEVDGRVYFRVFPFRQGAGIPATFEMNGGYGFSNVSGDDLSDNSLILTAEGFRFGLALYRSFATGPRHLILGVSADARIYDYQLEDTVADTVSYTRRVEPLYGFSIGYTLGAGPDTTAAVRVLLQVDSDLSLTVGPGIEFRLFLTPY